MRKEILIISPHSRIFRVLLLSLLFFIPFSYAVYAQSSLLIFERTGDETGISIDRIGKIAFASGNLTIDRRNGMDNSFLINTISSIKFTDQVVNTSVDELNLVGSDFIIFPNPAFDELNIQIIPVDQVVFTLEIISYNGKTMISKNFLGSDPLLRVNIASLPKGLYLCKLVQGSNRQLKKFIKN